jgi:hypothetical protein
MVYYKAWCGCYLKAKDSITGLAETIYPCGRPAHKGIQTISPKTCEVKKLRRKDLPSEVIVYQMKKILLGK